VTRDRHHVVVVGDEPEFGVERDVLAEMARRVVRLGAEDRSRLVDALEDADHRLLVELRALRQIRGSTEVVDGEDVGAALGRGGDDLRGLDLGEAQPVERVPKACNRGGSEAEDRLLARMAQRERREVESRGELCRQAWSPQVQGCALGRPGDDLHFRVVKLGAIRRARRGDDRPLHRHHRLGRKLGQPLGLVGIVDDDLPESAAVAQDQEAHSAEPALAMQPAGQPDALANVLALLDGQDS
jgi:hypothetical protein